MNYQKPVILEVDKNLPPVTVNFAPPAVETNNKIRDNITSYKKEIWIKIESIFWIQPDLTDKRLSEAAKQI